MTFAPCSSKATLTETRRLCKIINQKLKYIFYVKVKNAVDEFEVHFRSVGSATTNWATRPAIFYEIFFLPRAQIGIPEHDAVMILFQAKLQTDIATRWRSVGGRETQF